MPKNSPKGHTMKPQRLPPASVLKHPGSAPRLDPAHARVLRSYRLHPATVATIEEAAKLLACSQGQALDKLLEAARKERLIDFMRGR